MLHKGHFLRQERGVWWGETRKSAQCMNLCIGKSQNQLNVISGVESEDGCHAWGCGKFVAGRGMRALLKFLWPSCVAGSIRFVKNHQAAQLGWIHNYSRWSVCILSFNENLKSKSKTKVKKNGEHDCVLFEAILWQTGHWGIDINFATVGLLTAPALMRESLNAGWEALVENEVPYVMESECGRCRERPPSNYNRKASTLFSFLYLSRSQESECNWHIHQSRANW